MWNYQDQFEITMMRREERAILACCEIYDAVAMFIMDRDVFDKQTMLDAMKYAVERFDGHPVLPKEMIAQHAARQVNAERKRQTVIASQPQPVRKDRFGRPIQPKTDVVSYAYRPA